MSKNRCPRGKLNAEDQGATRMAITVKDGTVIVAFGKPMDWARIRGGQALGKCLLKRVEEIKQ